jgi:hypothetical protein
MADGVNLPLTGAGDVAVKVATDDAGAFGQIQLIGFAVQSPHDQILVSTNLSAGGNVDLTAADIATGRVGRLLGADIGCSVPIRCDIQVVNGARTTRTSIYTGPGETFPWRVPIGGKWIELAGGAGKAFGVSITNLDVNQAADVRTTLFWDEVTP